MAITPSVNAFRRSVEKDGTSQRSDMATSLVGRWGCYRSR